MAAIEAFAPAKINLTLHVTGRRADGYHLLDSLVAFAGIGDLITVRRAAGLSLSVTGPKAAGIPAGADNLVLRAARLAGVRDAAITLQKNLPAAAGIGGGSSDAAATLRALRQSHSATVADPLVLGADVPVCLLARSARMRGIGERIEPVAGVPPLPCVLVNPGIALATPAVFAALAQSQGDPMPDPPGFAGAADCARWLAARRNDLQTPALALAAPVGAALAALSATGALLARMSGSGATCFGLYADAPTAERAAGRIAAASPDWWVVATTLAQE